MRLPSTFFQGKGLLATESPMTLPFKGGFAPLLTEVFFEFRNQTGALFRLHELEDESEYEMIISQRGGLVRYAIGDRVRVAGFIANTPNLIFIGRATDISDMVGEKLNEQFVRTALTPLLPKEWDFMLVARIKPNTKPYYELLVDPQRAAMSATDEKFLDKLKNEADLALAKAHHYSLAKKLNQLDPLEIKLQYNLREKAFIQSTLKGRKLGNIKDMFLIKYT